MDSLVIKCFWDVVCMIIKQQYPSDHEQGKPICTHGINMFVYLNSMVMS